MAFIELFNAVYLQDRVSYEIQVVNYNENFCNLKCTKAVANEIIFAVPPKDRAGIEKIIINENCKADVFIRLSDRVLVFDVNSYGVTFIYDRERRVLE